MSKWRTRTLGEVCDLYQPKTISMKEMKPSGEFPVYGANGQIGFYDKFNHEDAQILLSCRGNCGTVNVSQPKSWINGNAMVCAPKSADLSKDFLAYFLQSVDWKPVITGTAQPQITRQPLAKIALPLPPIDEQRRIVETLDDHLSRLDKSLAVLEHAESQTLVFRRSILNSLLNPQLAHAETGAERMNIPKHWSTSTMGQIGKYLNGRAFREADWKTSGRPIIRIQNLTGSGKSFNYFQGEVEPRYLVKEGDLLFSWAATLGTYIWHGPEAVLNQHIFKVESNINPKFHRYLLEHSIQEMQSKTHGSGMVHITKSEFDKIEVAVPPLDEQQRIVENLDDLLSRLDSTRKSISNQKAWLATLRRSILKKAFIGELGTN